MIRLLFSLIIICPILIFSQVGINTNSPSETLDINGSLRVREITKIGPDASAKDSIMAFDEDGVVKRVSANQIVKEATNIVSTDVNNTLIEGADGGAYLGPIAYTGHFIIDATGAKNISGLPFKPSSISFVAHGNVETLNLDSDNGLSNNNTTIVNSFGSMNGYARNDNGAIVQQTIYVGGSGNSINDISRYSSSTKCIGLRYSDQNGNSFGKTDASLTSFNADGFTLNVTNKIDNVVVLFTAYR